MEINLAEMDTQSVAMLAALLLVPVFLVVFIIRRRLARTIDARLKAASPYLLHDFLLPDGNDGEIHLEYMLLTTRGILIVDTKDISGNIFGSDAMEEWTVIDENRRFTFQNPLPGLLDRIAAVKALAPDVPVEGYVAFTDKGRFSKGQPGKVIFFDTLIEHVSENAPEQSSAVIDSFLPCWEQLAEKATVKGVAQALVS